MKIPRAKVVGLFSRLDREDVVRQTLSTHQDLLVTELLKQFNTTAELYIALRAMFSHELRTPLSVIMGYNDLLLDGTVGSLTAEQIDILRREDKNAQELFALITTILDLSRLQVGQLP